MIMTKKTKPEVHIFVTINTKKSCGDTVGSAMDFYVQTDAQSKKDAAELLKNMIKSVKDQYNKSCRGLDCIKEAGIYGC